MAHDALMQPESRAAFRRILNHGWTDAIRTRYPDGAVYTFWDYTGRLLAARRRLPHRPSAALARRPPTACSMPASTRNIAAARRPATTRRPGSVSKAERAWPSALHELVAAELAEPVDPRVADMAAAIAARYRRRGAGGAVLRLVPAGSASSAG